MFRQGDVQRTATDAQNVRYEDGVTKNAPGYTQVQIGSLVTGLLAHWRMDEASSDRLDASINSYDLTYNLAPIPLVQVTGKIGKAAQIPTLTHPGFGISVSSLTNTTAEPLIQMANASFTVSGWFNIAATGLETLMFSWPGASLSVSSGAFVSTLFESSPSTGFITHTWASSVPVGSWFFAAMTYDSTVAGGTINLYINNTVDSSPVTGVLLGAAGPQTVQVLGGSPPFNGTQQLAVDSLSAWQRALTTGQLTTLYNSGNGLDFPFLSSSGPYSLLYQGNLIGAEPIPLIGAHGGVVEDLARSFVSNVFLLTPSTLYTGTAPTTGYPWTATDFFDTILLAQHDNPAQYWTAPTPNVCQAIPGLPSADSQWDGVEAFFGHALLWKDDRLKWSDKDDYTNWIPVAQTAASAVFTIGPSSYTQPATGSTVAIPVTTDPVAAGIVVGQFIFVQDNRGSGTSNQFYNYYQVTAVSTTTITGRLQDLTGHTATSSVIASGQQLFTVDANEAGETRVVGSRMNGKILKIIAMGDYAYIFKERSVQSVQYVGLESGTFFIHPELSDEGALSRTAILNLGDGRIVFLGHKELYLYIGGPHPQPIATQVTRQVLKEIDRTRLQEIVMVHKEIKHEVWVSYPIAGGQKTLIWNYVEDTCSFDYYDASLAGISAAADVDFSVDPPWDSLPESLTWDNMDPTLDWLDFSGSSTDRILLLAFGDGEIDVWGFGNTYNRNGRGYKCLSETQDFDLEEPDIWKYVDVVVLGLEIISATNQTRTIFIQVGQRAGLGGPEDNIVWTDPLPVSVSGNTSDIVKVNPGGAGRYLRLRIYSQDPDVQWAVSSFEIHCRPGGTY
jgi:hypothetical protein